MIRLTTICEKCQMKLFNNRERNDHLYKGHKLKNLLKQEYLKWKKAIAIANKREIE